ncbi:hypothetical protein NW757_005505 [Fusarium falciforme]|nr:hypothetical protein NW757_005505 [Fusarium falciforme]
MPVPNCPALLRARQPALAFCWRSHLYWLTRKNAWSRCDVGAGTEAVLAPGVQMPPLTATLDIPPIGSRPQSTCPRPPPGDPSWALHLELTTQTTPLGISLTHHSYLAPLGMNASEP